MSFDACMARDWPGVEDKEAFCATLERGEIQRGGLKIDLSKCFPVPSVGKRLSFEVIAKQDEKRIVTAWASVVTKDDGTPIVDAQGDVISIEDLEQAFIRSFADGGLNRGKVMHNGGPKADIVQAITLSSAEREALGFGKGREGAIVKIRVNDSETWEAVKAGSLPELSIGGSGNREAL